MTLPVPITEAQTQELLAVCKEQHKAIDSLFARMIDAMPDFFPSQCGQPWAAIVRANQLITAIEKKDEELCARCKNDTEGLCQNCHDELTRLGANTVMIEDWSVGGMYQADKPRLHGKVFGHPRFKAGTVITTSAIVARKGEETVITRSGTEYRLGKCNAEYLKAFPTAVESLLKLPEQS